MEGGDGRWRWKVEMEGGDGGWRWRVEIEGRDGEWRWRVEMEGRDGEWRWRVEMEGRNGKKGIRIKEWNETDQTLHRVQKITLYILDAFILFLFFLLFSNVIFCFQPLHNLHTCEK